jgi:hypothetical protein
MGRIQGGGEYARLTVVEYNECLGHLLACPPVIKRSEFDGT